MSAVPRILFSPCALSLVSVAGEGAGEGSVFFPAERVARARASVRVRLRETSMSRVNMR